MPRILHDIVFNPTPKDCLVSIYGKMFTFQAYKYTPIVISNDIRFQEHGLSMVRKVGGPHGLYVLDHDELRGGRNREYQSEEENQKYAEDYLKKITWDGLNKCITVLQREYKDHPEADNRRLVAAHKEPQAKTRLAKKMLAMLEELEKLVSRHDRLDEEEEIAATRKLVRKQPVIDFEAIPMSELRTIAKDRGIKTRSTMSKEDLIGELYEKDKADAEAEKRTEAKDQEQEPVVVE